MRKLGGGIRLTHPWYITVNNEVTIGKNANLFKGCTIGEVNHGSYKGCPTIGDNVEVFANATICGNIHIGNNVSIASGSFVNFDVPDDSVVIGNPGIIHRKHIESYADILGSDGFSGSRETHAGQNMPTQSR